MMNPIYFVVILVFVAVAFMISQGQSRKTQAATQEFLTQHPEAAKIYLFGKFGIVSEAVVVGTVDGQPPCFFAEGGLLGIPGLPGGKTGLYVLPGTRTLELQYTRNRPGVFYKNVTNSTGLVKKDFETEANKTYFLGFDRMEETFTFTEQA
jgi:hypothetical protein